MKAASVDSGTSSTRKSSRLRPGPDKDKDKDADDESQKYRRKNCSFDYKDPHCRRLVKGLVQFRFKTKFRNTIYDTLRKRPNWKVTESEMDWDLHWCEREWMSEWYDHVHLESWQRVNHYRNGRELCRKDLMYRNIKKFRRRLERDKQHEYAAKFDFVPATFVLPSDYAIFVEEFKRRPSITWIMKPIGKAQGKGIFLFRKLSEISDWKEAYKQRMRTMRHDGGEQNGEIKTAENYVVQCYLAKPYLIGGKKFDMRLYALVTSFSPLKCWIYRKGFARFSASRYDTSDLKNTSIHLTNVAVQKHNSEYNQDTGGKWSLREVKTYFAARHGLETANRAFNGMQNIITRSLEAVADVMLNDKHCFELYGYDIMFDSNLKPWLLEVNASPSLTANTKVDYRLKFQMLNEVLDIIDVEKKHVDHDKLHVGGFDMVYNQKEMEPYPGSVYNTLIGAEVPEPLPLTQEPYKPGTPAASKKGAGSSGPGKSGSSRRSGSSLSGRIRPTSKVAGRNRNGLKRNVSRR